VLLFVTKTICLPGAAFGQMRAMRRSYLTPYLCSAASLTSRPSPRRDVLQTIGPLSSSLLSHVFRVSSPRIVCPCLRISNLLTLRGLTITVEQEHLDNIWLEAWLFAEKKLPSLRTQQRWKNSKQRPGMEIESYGYQSRKVALDTYIKSINKVTDTFLIACQVSS